MIHRKHSGFVSVLFVIFSNFVVCRVSVFVFLWEQQGDKIFIVKRKKNLKMYLHKMELKIFFFFRFLVGQFGE